MHLVFPENASAHYNPNLVPTERCWVLNLDMLADTQPGKGAGVLVIQCCNILSTGSCKAVTIFGLGLLLLRGRLRVGRNTRPTQVSTEGFGREASSEVGSTVKFQETSVKLLTVSVAGRCHFEYEVLDGLNGSLSVAIRLWVIWRHDHMSNSPLIHELSELGASIRP